MITVLAAAAVFAAGGGTMYGIAKSGTSATNDALGLPKPLLQRPPVFLTRGKPVNVKANAAGRPKQLRLVVRSGKGTVKIPLQAATGGGWKGTVSGTNTQADTLTFQVEATYASTTLTSPQYTSLTTSTAPLRVSPVQTQLVRTDAVSWPWGTGATEFGKTGGLEAAAIVPSAIATRPDGTVAVLDTANSRIVELDLTGHVVGTTPLPSQTVDYLVSDPATGNLTAVDTVNFVAYTVENNTLYTVQQLNLASYVDTLRGFYVGGLGSTQTAVYALLGDGSAVPVIIDGVATTLNQQDTYRQVGVPTNGGLLLFEKAGDALRIGVVASTGGAGSSPIAPTVSVPLAETVLDVTPIDLHKLHKLAFLVTTFANGAVKDNLVRVNLTTGEATISDITVNVPGDMTSRVAPLDTNVGVVLFTGDTTGGQVAVFNGLGI